MTFPTKFSERMRAAMFPQQNLKRREAAFLLGATAFRTREMQKCASPFVEVRQIEFLARETPNYIATNLHTYPINGHASVSGSHLRKRSDEGRTRSVAMIHRMTETEPQGFRQHNLSSTRTNVRFLSSLGRLVLSSMLDAKEQGRSAPRKAPSYLSPNQGIDPLT